MRKTELLEIGCLEATKKMLKFSKKEEKKSRKQRLQKKMKMRKFEYEVSVKICKKGEILAVSFFRIKEMLAGQVQPEIVVFLNKKERTYLSYLPREAKWRTATIIKIMGYFYGKSTHNRRECPVHGYRGGSRGRFYYRITTFGEGPWDARDPHKTTFMTLK